MRTKPKFDSITEPLLRKKAAPVDCQNPGGRFWQSTDKPRCFSRIRTSQRRPTPCPRVPRAEPVEALPPATKTCPQQRCTGDSTSPERKAVATPKSCPLLSPLGKYAGSQIMQRTADVRSDVSDNLVPHSICANRRHPRTKIPPPATWAPKPCSSYCHPCWTEVDKSRRLLSPRSASRPCNYPLALQFARTLLPTFVQRNRLPRTRTKVSGLTPYALRLTPYALRLTPYALRLTPYAFPPPPSPFPPLY
jgi:hypothetical protein